MSPLRVSEAGEGVKRIRLRTLERLEFLFARAIEALERDVPREVNGVNGALLHLQEVRRELADTIEERRQKFGVRQ